MARYTGLNTARAEGTANIDIKARAQLDLTELADLRTTGFPTAHDQRIRAFIGALGLCHRIARLLLLLCSKPLVVRAFNQSVEQVGAQVAFAGIWQHDENCSAGFCVLGNLETGS